MRRATSRLVVAVAAASALLAPPVATAKPSARSVVLFAYRTSTAAGSLDLMVEAVPWPDRPSFVGGVLTTIEEGAVTGVPVGYGAPIGAANKARANAGGRRVVLCRDHGVCQAESQTWGSRFSLFVDSEEGWDGINAVWVTATGSSVRYSFEASGWAVRRVPGSYRWVGGDETSQLSAYGLGTGVEVAGGASARGGRYGSIAVAIAPCSQTTTGVVSRGAGTFRLEGGERVAELTCPAHDNWVASWTRSATTWRAVGTVAGETEGADARLFVLDRPRTLPVPRNWPWS